jgi:hypothetical protein
MFHFYLANNLFVRLIQAAFLDGYGYDAIHDEDDSQGAADGFAEVACKIGTNCIGLAETIQVAKDKYADDYCLDTVKIGVSVSLFSILKEAWLEGWNAMQRSEWAGMESYELWREKVAAGEHLDANYVNKAYNFAVNLSSLYKDWIAQGEKQACWKLALQENVLCGTWHGSELQKGDYVEYGYRACCRVISIQADSHTAQVVRIGRPNHAERAGGLWNLLRYIDQEGNPVDAVSADPTSKDSAVAETLVDEYGNMRTGSWMDRVISTSKAQEASATQAPPNAPGPQETVSVVATSTATVPLNAAVVMPPAPPPKRKKVKKAK